jgi:hypothetical protein
MGPLIGIGGIAVPSQEVHRLEQAIGTLCDEYDFPPKEVFKWSFGRECWMRDSLVNEKRKTFFVELLSLIKQSEVTGIVVIEDTNFATATGAPNAEVDVISLFFERMNKLLTKKMTEGIVIADRPSGGRRDEDRFLVTCIETLEAGTDYVKLDRIALNVLSSPSKFVRLLQVADVITSCTVQAVAGECRFSPPILAEIKELLDKDMGRIGGVGLKIHPDYKYANLYYWLLGDGVWIKPTANVGFDLPWKGCPYCSDPLKH